jgi:hypothetical protein
MVDSEPSRSNPAVRLRPDEAALIERVLRTLAVGETMWRSDFKDEDRLRLVRAWIRFERFRTRPVNAPRPVEAHAIQLGPSEVGVQ